MKEIDSRLDADPLIGEPSHQVKLQIGENLKVSLIIIVNFVYIIIIIIIILICSRSSSIVLLRSFIPVNNIFKEEQLAQTNNF